MSAITTTGGTTPAATLPSAVEILVLSAVRLGVSAKTLAAVASAAGGAVGMMSVLTTGMFIAWMLRCY
jgi:hypothetical protein